MEKLWSISKEAKFASDIKIITNFLQVFGTNREFRKVREIWKWMREQKISPDERAYAAMINICTQNKDVSNYSRKKFFFFVFFITLK